MTGPPPGGFQKKRAARWQIGRTYSPVVSKPPFAPALPHRVGLFLGHRKTRPDRDRADFAAARVGKAAVRSEQLAGVRGVDTTVGAAQPKLHPGAWGVCP